MRILRDQAGERWLLDKIKAWLEAQPRGEGYHVSELLYPRQAYWKRVDPQPMSDRNAGYFVAGLGHHYILEAIIEGSKKVGKADAGSHQWKGIYYSPDIRTPHPEEIKTTRAKYGPKMESERGYLAEYEHYLKQLTAYMALDGDQSGGLLVFYLNLEQENKQSYPAIRRYAVRMTLTELAQRREELLQTKALLAKAIRQKKPGILPACPAWMARNCPWAAKCQCGSPPKERVKL